MGVALPHVDCNFLSNQQHTECCATYYICGMRLVGGDKIVPHATLVNAAVADVDVSCAAITTVGYIASD